MEMSYYINFQKISINTGITILSIRKVTSPKSKGISILKMLALIKAENWLRKSF